MSRKFNPPTPLKNGNNSFTMSDFLTMKFSEFALHNSTLEGRKKRQSETTKTTGYAVLKDQSSPAYSMSLSDYGNVGLHKVESKNIPFPIDSILRQHRNWQSWSEIGSALRYRLFQSLGALPRFLSIRLIGEFIVGFEGCKDTACTQHNRFSCSNSTSCTHMGQNFSIQYGTGWAFK